MPGGLDWRPPGVYSQPPEGQKANSGLDALPEGATLELQTQNHRYRVLNQGRGQVLISGHPEFCPHPRQAYINGSTWCGSMIKLGFIGRGMHLEFAPADGGVITTSRIVDVWEV